jgi:hypothetical protein
MLVKRFIDDTADNSKNQEFLAQVLDSAQRIKNRRRREYKRLKYQVDGEFGDFFNPIKKGSTVSKISHLFHDLMGFYNRFEGFAKDIGKGLKNDHRLENDLVYYRLEFGKIIINTMSTNVKKVRLFNTG